MNLSVLSQNNIIFLLLLSVPLLIYLALKIYQVLTRKKNWKKAQDLIDKNLRQNLEEVFIPYQYLDDKDKSRLEELVAFFLLTKRMNPIGDISLTSKVKTYIAAQACLLLVNVKGTKDVFPDLSNIFIIADAYDDKDNFVDPDTGRPASSPRLGESIKRGPMVLSLSTLEAEMGREKAHHNLVIHEFSHQLDQEDGYFDGTPPLKSDKAFSRWATVMGKEFSSLKRRVKSFKKSDIDSYGATNEAEFFAVCNEYFFTSPHQMEMRHKELFDLYHEFFKLDPRRWTKL